MLITSRPAGTNRGIRNVPMCPLPPMTTTLITPGYARPRPKRVYCRYTSRQGGPQTPAHQIQQLENGPETHAQPGPSIHAQNHGWCPAGDNAPVDPLSDLDGVPWATLHG